MVSNCSYSVLNTRVAVGRRGGGGLSLDVTLLSRSFRLAYAVRSKKKSYDVRMTVTRTFELLFDISLNSPDCIVTAVGLLR